MIRSNKHDKSGYFLLPIYVLKDLSDIFSKMYDEKITQINDYKNNVDDNVIVYD